MALRCKLLLRTSAAGGAGLLLHGLALKIELQGLGITLSIELTQLNFQLQPLPVVAKRPATLSEFCLTLQLPRLLLLLIELLLEMQPRQFALLPRAHLRLQKLLGLLNLQRQLVLLLLTLQQTLLDGHFGCLGDGACGNQPRQGHKGTKPPEAADLHSVPLFPYREPPLAKERPKTLGALVLQYAAHNLGVVIQTRFGEQIDYAARSPGLGVGSPVDHARDARMDDGAGAHRAGLQSDVQGATRQAVVLDLQCRSTQRPYFGVGRRIA